LTDDWVQLGNTLAPIIGILLALLLITYEPAGPRYKPPLGPDAEAEQRQARYGTPDRKRARRRPVMRVDSDWEVHES